MHNTANAASSSSSVNQHSHSHAVASMSMNSSEFARQAYDYQNNALSPSGPSSVGNLRTQTEAEDDEDDQQDDEMYRQQNQFTTPVLTTSDKPNANPVPGAGGGGAIAKGSKSNPNVTPAGVTPAG